MSDSVRPQRRQPTGLPRLWDSPGKNTGVGCHSLLQCVKVKSLSCVQPSATPWTAAYQAPPSMGFFQARVLEWGAIAFSYKSMEFSRPEYWSGFPFPSPMQESEKWKWSRSVMSDSLQPHGLQPTRLLHPLDFPGKNTGLGCQYFGFAFSERVALAHCN